VSRATFGTAMTIGDFQTNALKVVSMMTGACAMLATHVLAHQPAGEAVIDGLHRRSGAGVLERAVWRRALNGLPPSRRGRKPFRLRGHWNEAMCSKLNSTNVRDSEKHHNISHEPPMKSGFFLVPAN
jgi:hypothetical protein